MIPIPNLSVALDQVEAARDVAYQALIQHLTVWTMELATTRYQRSAFVLDPEGLVVLSAKGTDYCLNADGSFHLNEIAAISKSFNELMIAYHAAVGTDRPQNWRFDQLDCFTIKGPRHPR